MYTSAELQSIAVALLDGGWTSQDSEWIQRIYGFSGEELEQVIECMKGYELRYLVICEDDDEEVCVKMFEDYDDAREFFHSMCARADTTTARVYDNKADERVCYYVRKEVA